MECVTSSERHFVNISMCMLVACVYSSIKYISFQITALAVSVPTVHVKRCRLPMHTIQLISLCNFTALYSLCIVRSGLYNERECVCVLTEPVLNHFQKTYTSLLQFIVRALSYERRTLSPTTVLLFN